MRAGTSTAVGGFWKCRHGEPCPSARSVLLAHHRSGCVLVVSLGVEAWKLSALRRYMTVGGAAEGDGGGGWGADTLVLLWHPRPAPSPAV